jgi:hypothetical protein
MGTAVGIGVAGTAVAGGGSGSGSAVGAGWQAMTNRGMIINTPTIMSQRAIGRLGLTLALIITFSFSSNKNMHRDNPAGTPSLLKLSQYILKVIDNYQFRP